MHRAHSGGVWGTGESQVDLSDVLAGSYDRTVLPAEALLGAVGHVQGVDGEDQGLRAQLLVKALCSALLLGLPHRVMKVQAGIAPFPLLSTDTGVAVICVSAKTRERLAFASTHTRHA